MDKDKKKVDFIVLVLRDFSKKKGLPVVEAFDYLYKYKGISFLEKYYETEHLLSMREIVEDITKICRNNGGDIE